jgi:pimeloyl-ACP methyl ester carboxylesterase
MNTHVRWWRLLAPLLLIGGAQAAQRSCEYRMLPGQLYAHGLLEQGMTMPLYLDAYLPTTCTDGAPGSVPPVILFPGGGFGDKVAGRRSPPIVQMADGLARAGFAVFVSEYRPRSWRGIPAVSETKTEEELAEYMAMAAEGPYPVETAVAALIAVEDAFKLKGWIRGKAGEYQLDLMTQGVIGPSSGSTVSLSMEYMGDNLAEGVANMHAVVDLWGDFYPHTMMMPGESPLLIVAGTKDLLIDYELTTDIMHRAFIADVEASRITMPGVGHGLVEADLFNRKVVGTDMTIFEVIVQFFEAKLRLFGRQVWPPAGQGYEMTAEADAPMH